MTRHGFRVALGAALLAGTVIVACADEDADGRFDDAGPGGDSGLRNETGTDGLDETDSGKSDAGTDARDAADEDSGPTDAGRDVMGLPPGTILDLTATAYSHVRVKLTWTSPPGSTSTYEIRYAETPITNEAEFLAATVATTAEPVVPLSTGSVQTAIVTGLTPETTYHFVVRVKDAGDAGDADDADAGISGPLSNDAVATTSGRAKLLVSEIAPANTAAEGGDFIELVATQAGSVADLQIFMAYSALVHTFGPLNVAAGDRIVIHASGLPGPTNFVQEDQTNDKASSTEATAAAGAYDVYSTVTDLGPSATITIKDDTAFQDAVPYGARTTDWHAAEINALIDATYAYLAGEWPFSMGNPYLDATRCSYGAEIVNASGNDSPECGGFPGWLVPGSSIQRNGIVDTNTRADFAVAPQTRGEVNAPFCGAETAKLVVSELNPRANLVELSVLEGGRLRAFELRTNPQDETGAGAGSNLLTLPDICAVSGDVIVVHLGTTGSPGETTAKDEHKKATYASYYDNAWDFVTPNTLTFASSVVVALRTPANVFADVGAFSDRTTVTTSEYVSSLRYMQGKNLWLPADCGGALCGNSTTPTAREVAASWTGLDTTTGTGVKRTGTDVPSQASVWSVGAASFGQ